MGKSKNKCKTKDCENKTEGRRKHYCPECSVAKKTKTTLVKCWSCNEAHPEFGKFCPLCGVPASGPANKDLMPSTESDVMSRVKTFPMDDVAALTQQFEKAKLDMSASADASSSTASSRPAEEQPGTLSDTSGNGGHQTLNQQSNNNISVQCSSGDNESATTSEKSNKPCKEDHKKPDASGSSVEANSTKLPEKSHQPSENNSGKISNPDSVDDEPKPDKEEKHSTPVLVCSTTIAVPSEGSDMKSQSKDEVGMVNSAPPDGKTTNNDDIKSDAVHSKGEANFEIKFVDKEYGENYGAGFSQQGVKEPTNKASGTAENGRQESQVFGSSAPDPKSVGHAFGTKKESVDKANNSTAKDGMSPSVNNKTTEDHGTPSTNGGHKNQQSKNDNTKSSECSSDDNKSAAPAKGTHAAIANGTQNENTNSRQTDSKQTNTSTEGSSVDHDPLRNKQLDAQATESPGSQHFKPGEPDNRQGGVMLVKKALKDIVVSNQNKNQGIPKVLTDGDAKERMTVFFHVVVTPEFQFNPKTDKIVMRIGPHSFGKFNYDIVEMDCIRMEDGYAFMEGKLTIKPIYFTNTNIQYKYCLKRSGGTEDPYTFEWIHKSYSQGIINRLMKIPKEACIKQGIWHQFDGAMQIKETDKFRMPKTESKSWQGRLWRGIKNILHLGSDIESKLVQDHIYAMVSYLPEWEGFVCNQKGQMTGRETAVEAIDRLCNVTDCMSNILVIPEWHTSGFSSDKWNPGEFSVEKVLQNYFNDKLQEIGRDAKNLSQTVLSQRLVSGLAIALVDERFPFLEHETRRLLLRSLVLPSDLEKPQYEKLIEDIKNTFPGQHLRSIAGVLENLCNRAMNPGKVDLTFILVLPLLHFMRGESKPMEWPKALNQYSFNDDRWWGHHNLDVRAVKGNRIHQMEDFSTMLIKIQPLLSVDLLMQRTFLATLKFEALDILKHIKFDFLVACAFVRFSLNQKRLYLTPSDVETLKLILPDLVKHGKEENTKCGERCNMELHFRQRANVVDVVLQTFEVLMTKTFDCETLQQCLQLFSEALRQFEVHADGDKESIQKAVTQRTHTVLTLTLKYFRTFDIFYYLMTVNGFFNISFTNEKANHVWVSGLLSFLVRQIDMLNLEGRIRYYCNNDLSAFNVDIQKAFSDKAFQAINQVMKEPEQFFNTFSYYDNSKARIRVLLSHFVKQSWDGKTVTLKMCLSWRALSGFFRQSDSISILNEDAQTQVLTVKSKIEDATARLINGHVTVEELRILLEHKDHFLALCEMIDVPQITRLCSQMKNVIGQRDIVSKILDCRETELRTFEDVRYRVGILLHVCSSLRHDHQASGRRVNAVDVTYMMEALETDASCLNISDFCDPIQAQVVINNLNNITPVITFFNLSPVVSDMLVEIEKIHDSRLFQEFWRKRSAKVLEQHSECSLMTIGEVQSQVWRFVKEEWDQFRGQLITGLITLLAVKNKLGEIKDDLLEKELGVFKDENAPNNWITERCKQVRLYRQLGRCLESAKIILKIKKAFDLKGNFKSVELLCSTSETEFEKKCLKDLNRGVATACKELEGVTEDQRKCLNTLIKCKDLITWIKKEIKNMQELKVFVDLAMIQAGETDIEVGRVSCLHQAATGYAAFIFDLTEDSDYTYLMLICQHTWTALENDPKLSKKLEDINRHMEWLKGVKDSHGSVEVTSLRQVERINDGGIYEIGKLEEGTHTLRLRVPVEDDEEKIYTVEQLKDLQSKLMLVAGKAQQNTDAKSQVDRFVEVFDGAQDLEMYYKKMCISGNVLFTDLKIKLICDKKNKTPVHVDFCVVEQKPLFGKKELTDKLKELLNFMQGSLKQWYDYIDEKRDEFYELNIYTTKQLVILRRALAKFGEEDVNPEVYSLLSLVKPDCTVQDLRKAVAMVKKEKENQSNDDEINFREGRQTEDVLSDAEKDHLVAFWEELDGMLDEEQAMAVLEDKGIIDVEDAVTFISDSPYSKKTLEELVGSFYSRVGCTLSELKQQSHDDEEADREEQIGDVVRDEEEEQVPISLQNLGHGTESVRNELLEGMKNFKGTLIEKLNHLWKNYLSSTKSADLSDYVSVETLGSLLKHLVPDCQASARSFPPLLTRGRPNLIVCPARDVLHTVLSVYMESNGCLPTFDEVLLCNSKTSLEEVVLLWRRALNGTNVKTYSLVNADALDYDVSVDAVNKLHQLMKGKAGYQLVIVCNREREDQSRIVTALNSDRISSDKPTCRKWQDIQEYLCTQFIDQVQLTSGRLQPAATLTNHRTCVQAISSKRPGVGKSLLIQRYKEQLQRNGQHPDCCITVALQTTTVQEHDVAKILISQIQEMHCRFPRIVHLDVSPNVYWGLDHLLFNLLILNTICCSDGSVWRRHFYDLYLIEVTHADEVKVEETKSEGRSSKDTFFESLPTVLCRPPKETHRKEVEKSQQQLPEVFQDPLMDDQEFRSPKFQRPYQYLAGLDQDVSLDTFNFNRRKLHGNHVDCLATLLRHCGLPDPSWSELSHFACFLNKQLEACEGSVFCDLAMLADTGLDGFKTFVVKFMLQMSKDFATPSLEMSDQSFQIADNQEDEIILIQLRRRWETSPHPYIFFNRDNQTMTFMGFSIDRNGTLLDVDGCVLQKNVMTKSLMRGLDLQRVNLAEDFDSLPRDKKLQKLCMVMGIENVSNPDDTYELTTDNVKKILAIHMRFRCGIPVIVMGETGCGKTRLIRFMCQLQSNRLVADQTVNNMILMKVHGGTSSEYIVQRVRKAEQQARENKAQYNIDTVLFFDEANTTEAIGIIKEIMCDGRMNGQQIDFSGSGLKIVAACNPYKRHTDEMIGRLEAAGLGYHIKASETKDRLGRIPLRQLVYRVQALPPSMLPLVWDFGQLNSTVETMYISQIVQRFVNNGQIYANLQQVKVVSEVLSTAQAFMREQKNECSFVSLRDVERTLNVMVWFFNKRHLLRPLIDNKLENARDRVEKEMGSEEEFESEDVIPCDEMVMFENRERVATEEDGEEECQHYEYESEDGILCDEMEMFENRDRVATEVDSEEECQYYEYESEDDNLCDEMEMEIDDLTWALVLALGVCYHACLDEKREDFRDTVAESFRAPMNVYGGSERIYRDINSCQDIFLDNIELGPNIARNLALKENIFMMIICIELRIPLFLVGKPGSSKSLAKTIVADAMQGDSAASPFFRELKQVHMISYQCSPLSTPDGIVGTFRQCSRFQESKDLNKFVSVVVLDEVGLAEDSPRMPLKTLHPLLEYGSEEDDNPPPHKKVAFIGISNWALDPAKMNRGILVSRGVPNEEELIESAKGICASETSNSEVTGASHLVSKILKPLAQGYLEIYLSQDHDFFGLRDFYSLIKMVNQFAKNSGNMPTWAEIEHAIRRNFGGLLETEDHIKTFEKKLKAYVKKQKCERDPDCTPSGLIKASLDAQGQTQVEGTKKVGHGTSDGDSRYLLVLTEKFAALPILQEHLNKMKDAVIIYGSSFPFDQEYTQVCRNINRIKLCMEAGRTVVLLNLENLYESLYDALNQYYVYFGGQRYVDLGLGNHRVKCRVHESFRLIVVADKEVVHERFPIPLINRLEKHFLAMTTMLNEEQQGVVEQLEAWVTLFTTIKHQSHLQAPKESFKRTDAFVGYHGDTIAALVYQTWASCDGENEKVVEKVKDQLLMCATPESVTRLSKTSMSDEERKVLTNTYFREQKHGCLADYLADKIQKNYEEGAAGILAQVTTYSRLLIEEDSEALSEATKLDNAHIKMISLQEFQHEQQFSLKVEKFFDENRASERLLLVQCDASSDTTHLISCASYRVQDERENALSAIQERIKSEQEYIKESRAHVVFIIQLPRVNQCFNGFQGGIWASTHIDDLQPPKENRPDVYELMGRKMSDLFTVSKNENQEDIPVSDERDKDGKEYMQRDSNDEGNMEQDSDNEESMEGDSDDDSNSVEDNSEDEESMEDDSGDEDSTEDMDQEDVSKGEREDVSKVPSAEDTEQENEAMAGSNVEESTVNEDTLVDFNAILLDSIHPATARISDPTSQRHRSTERVRLLVNLLKGDSPHQEFLHCLKHLIIKLVKEKDSRAYDASQWLTREALDIKEVQESGTFRQACWQRLTATVAPFLAEVIAICDISNNLSLLESQEADKAWLQKLWLSIFSSVDLINISYEMCLSPEKKVQRSEVPLQEKGYGGKSFKALFPFSWIIKGRLYDILKFAAEAKVEAEATTDHQFLKIVQESEVGRKLQTAIITVGVEKVVEHYCSDFIRMACKISHEDEHKLICDHIISASYSVVRELGGDIDSVNSVAAIHLAFNKFQARFEHLSQLVDICPIVLNKQPEEELDTKEMTIDVTSLKYVLEEIDSKGFKSQDGQRKWLSKIHTLCPVVQSMMGLYKKKKDIFGLNCQRILEECRCLWSRITVMKLFFEHVCLQNEEFADIVSPKCKTLWVALKKTADLKLNTSVKSLVNILNEINKKAGEKYYKSGIYQCGMCSEAIKNPVLLPCTGSHVFCKDCINGYFKTERAKKCADCKEELPEDFECKEQSEVSAVVAQHNAFRQCCNSFFMEVVSQLCFADGTPPSKDVIKKLLGYVTIDSKKQNRRVTRNVSPFPEDCIDPNPVVRSFLLQLLLQSNLEIVKEHVQEYLKNSRDLMERSDDAVSLCRLFVNCLEDTYYSGFPQDSDAKLIRLLLGDALGKLENAHLFFDRQNATADPLSVELLEAISQSRFALTVLADIIQRQLEDEQRYGANIKRLVAMLAGEARRFCQQYKQAQLYLVKYICRAYSKDALTCLKNDEQFNWILPDELKAQDLNVPDNCVIVGEMYINIREAIGQCVMDNDFEKMCKVVTNVKGNQKEKEVCLLLALFREITMNTTTTVEAKRISLEVKRKFGEIIQDMPFLKNKIVADTLLQNRGQNPQHILRVTPGLNLQDYSIQAAVTHLQIVLNVVERQSLTQCLAMLMRSPSQMQQAYLPAMPQDDRMEAQAALHQPSVDHNLTWYECPNGHLYTIGNCGQPNGTGYCSDCNVKIGGHGYAALPGNKVATMVDTTRTGHVLGSLQDQYGKQIVSERAMNGMATAVVRFLLHASMLLGTESQQGPQPIINMIDSHPPNVLEFLWQHLHNDVRLLSNATGKNRDDCIFILHKVIDNILHKTVPGQFQSGFQQLLSSKQSRKIWEENFTAMYITPLLQGLDELIDQSNQTLIADKRLSDDPLMRVLHTANAVKAEDLDKLEETSHVWQYRSRITIQCIHHALANEEDGDSLEVLRLFMEKEKHLRVVRHLPDIIRLQRLLINKYNRHIDSAEAINLNIYRFLDQQHATEEEEFKRLIDIFIDVWNSVRLDVALTVKLPIPKECCSEVMSYECNIAMLLPTRRESGLCSTGLVDFLIFTQNKFLERYHSIQELQMSKVKVDPSDLLMSHLIAYDPDRDLLPLILSQCQYIVRPMAENKIEYNLRGLELQLIERFVRGRAFIDRKFDQLFFRQDVRNASIFENLRDKIPQVELSTAVQTSIVADLKSFQDLCKSLASLDIAIGFLANYKAEGDMLIKKYLQDKLAMPLEKGLCSPTASQQCRLKHVLALWQVLAVEKALRLANDARDPFDGIGNEYREGFQEEQREDLVAKLRYIKVDLLCAELYEYIVLNLGRQSASIDEERTKWPILDTLKAHYTSKNEIGEIPGLNKFPDTLLLSQAVETWKVIAEYHYRQSVQG